MPPITAAIPTSGAVRSTSTTTASLLNAQLQQCPRFDRCSAPLCPLDSDWRRRTVTNRDPTCFYMLEAVKQGAEKRFEGRPDRGIYSKAVEMLSDRESIGASCRHALTRAARTGSTIDGGLRLRRAPITA